MYVYDADYQQQSSIAYMKDRRFAPSQKYDIYERTASVKLQNYAAPDSRHIDVKG